MSLDSRDKRVLDFDGFHDESEFRFEMFDERIHIDVCRNYSIQMGQEVPFSSLPNGSSGGISSRHEEARGERETDFFCDSFDSVECETD